MSRRPSAEVSGEHTLLAVPVPQLVIIGGAEDKLGERVVLSTFVRLAGGEAAKIVVVPAASEISNEVGETYSRVFTELGAADVQVLHVRTRDDAKRDEATALIDEATGVFFTGGEQLRLMNLIGGTHLDTALHRRVEKGMVVGGTSAGAAVMSATMIAEGETSAPRTGAVRTGPGLELLPGVIIDQHFAQRGRISRLLAVVAQFPHNLGVGIDEDTALVVRGHACEVVGRGAVTIIDAGEASFNDAIELAPLSCITLAGVTLHSLPAGRRFDLLERRPIFDPPSPALTRLVMRIVQLRTLHGSNLFSHRPVLRMTVDLEELVDKSSADLPGFTDRLVAALPGLDEHRCSRGRRGGFIERLREGTYMGHIIEHVALELSSPAGIEVGFGKTVYAGKPGHYHVAVDFKNEAGMSILLRAAFAMVSALVKGESYDPKPAIEQAREVAEDTCLGPSTKAIADAAAKRGIPWSRLNEGSLLVLGYGKARKFVQATTTCKSSYVAVEVAGDKQLTKALLERAGLPTPRGVVVRTEEEALVAFEDVGAPAVIKPLDGNQGKGVSLNVTTHEEARTAFAIAKEYRSRVLVEQQIEGRNYRVIVVGGKMVAASERLPAHVIGDGVSKVEQLIAKENQNPLRANGHNGALTRIEVDAIVLAYLAKTGRTLSDVPARGEMFVLRESMNLSTGGTARDVTDRVHPEVRRACERAALAIDLDVCGIDLVASDIALPLGESRGAVIELNAAPGIRMHEHPSEGKPRRVGEAIVEMLYPPGTPTRIPLISITGTNGKTTTARMAAHVMAESGLRVGLTTTEGIYIGGELVQKGDTTGPISAQAVLFDPTVECAVLETARGGIVRRGLGYDWSDVGVITNIQEDHLGQDGIEDLEDLVRVKSIVAERVREGGTIVLNAADPNLVKIPENRWVKKAPRKIVFFAADPDVPAFRHHLASGGTGYALEEGWIVEHTPRGETKIMRAREVPSSIDGTAIFQVENAMAAIAACRAVGMSERAVADAMRGFDASANIGRMNTFRYGEGHVVVDYAHNAAAFSAVCSMIRRWGKHRPVTGVVSVPGDRLESAIQTCGAALACGLDRIIVKEDRDLRGRAPGESAAMLVSALERHAPTLPHEVILDEAEAVRHAIGTMGPGEIVMIFTDDHEGISQTLRSLGAEPERTVEHDEGRSARRKAGRGTSRVGA